MSANLPGGVLQGLSRLQSPKYKANSVPPPANVACGFLSLILIAISLMIAGCGNGVVAVQRLVHGEQGLVAYKTEAARRAFAEGTTGGLPQEDPPNPGDESFPTRRRYNAGADNPSLPELGLIFHPRDCSGSPAGNPYLQELRNRHSGSVLCIFYLRGLPDLNLQHRIPASNVPT